MSLKLHKTRSRSPLIFAITCATCATLFAQPKSAVEFYDTTGATSVSKFGWTGDAASGNFYIRTPSDGTNGVTIKQGNLTANKISGDGSGLTNLPAQNVSAASVTGLSDSLAKKAAVTHTQSIASITGLSDSLAVKANASTLVTKTYVDTNLAKKANTGHNHVTTDVTWGTGTTGQVWKLGTSGQPAWGTDNAGSGGGVTLPIGITDVTGLPDSITNHRTAINGKASTTHAHAIGDVTNLQNSMEKPRQHMHMRSGM